MAAVGFALDTSNIQRDGIASWKFKTRSDIGHYPIGRVRDGKIAITPLTEITSYQQQKQHGMRIDASAKIMNTHKSKVIELLPTLGVFPVNHIITAQNGTTYTGDFGCHWRFVCEGGMEKQRYVEIFADGMLWIDHASYADLGTVLASPSAGTANSADYFYTWDPTDPTGYIGAACKTVQMSLNGTLEDVGTVRKFRLIIEGVGDQDDYGLTNVHTINILVEFEMRQTFDELAFMASSVALDTVGYSFTLADGATLVLPTQLGFQFEHGLLTDTKDIGFIKITGGGSISPLSFAALWT